MALIPHSDLLYALQDCFEGCWNRDTAIAAVGLEGNQYAIDTWNR